MPEPFIQDDFRSGKARGQIIALLLVGVLLAGSLVLAIAYRHDAFTKTAEMYFETDSASGLFQGTAVTMSGFRIGEVTGVTLLPNLKVKVSMTIRAEHMLKLREDASAELYKEDLLKPAVIAVDRGKSNQFLSPLAPQIRFERAESFADMAGDLKSKIAPILEDVKEITGTLRQRQDRLGEIMEEAARAARELAHAATEINAMSADVRKQVSTIGNQSVSTLAEANQTVVRLNGVIAQAEQSVATINGTLPQLVREASATLESLQAVARDARTISQAAAETLPGTLRNVQPAAEEAREIVRGVTRAWPIRDLLPAPPQPGVPLDSMDARKLHVPADR